LHAEKSLLRSSADPRSARIWLANANCCTATGCGEQTFPKISRFRSSADRQCDIINVSFGTNFVLGPTPVNHSTFSISLESGPAAEEATSAGPFREFVGDEENALVKAVESALDPGSTCNPLVFSGPTGVGKSLLAQGLAQLWRQRRPEDRVSVVTGADFARSYAHAVQTDTLADHRAKLATAALVVLDGLEELVKKPAAQQELIYVLDAALAEGVRVIVTSREPLSPGGPFLPGLASRLSAGLVVPLAHPGPAARRVLVVKMVEELGVAITPEAAELLAGELPGTADELRHALLQLCEPADEDSRVDEQAVRRFLEERTEQRRPTVNKIAAHVARRFRLKATDLQGKTRRREVVQARGVAMLLARRLTGASYQAVGRHFGGRDHSTVMHACRRITEQLKSDPALKRTVEELASPWAN
jgi:chromosomal replication initiator protein